MTARILVVDDKPNMRTLVASILQDLGDVVTADGGTRALELLRQGTFHVVVTDIRMPDMSGEELLRAVRKLEKPPEVLLMTGYATVQSAVEALRLGAYDYLTKPFDPDDMKHAVERALAKRGVGAASSSVRPGSTPWRGMVASSAAMRDVFRLVEKIAPSDSTVLLHGESGTGKELLAHAIHEASARVSKRFVAVNCAAIPSTLMESELFGYAKGAFSGAAAPRAGLFENADGGTLFLDEIGEMRRALQAKLTRALEARAVRRVGESQERDVDVRIIAATHRDLPSLVAQGAFREDLFYRLNTCIVRIPPLRERPEDIPLLVEHFLARRHESTGRRYEVTPEAMAVLSAHRWPGNVRELRSAIERAALVAEEGVIGRADLPPEISGIEVPRAEPPIDLGAMTYREAIDHVRSDSVKRYLETLLERFGGNVIVAAEHADVERESFYRLCRKHGINPTDYRTGGSDPKSRP